MTTDFRSRLSGSRRPFRPANDVGPSPAPIDLSTIDPAIWHVHSGGQSFGPYTIGQLQQFVIEGRLNAASRLAEGAEEPPHPIRDIARLTEALAPAFAERSRRRVEASNFLIMARAPLPAEAALWRDMPGCLDQLGKHVQAMPGAWILRSGHSLSAIREALTAALPKTVQVMVLETREARLGWIGFEEDMSETIRTVWNAALS